MPWSLDNCWKSLKLFFYEFLPSPWRIWWPGSHRYPPPKLPHWGIMLKWKLPKWKASLLYQSPQTERGSTGVLWYCPKSHISRVLISSVSAMWIERSMQIIWKLEGSYSSKYSTLLMNKLRTFYNCFTKSCEIICVQKGRVNLTSCQHHRGKPLKSHL